jgi:hypothetical protein
MADREPLGLEASRDREEFIIEKQTIMNSLQ